MDTHDCPREPRLGIDIGRVIINGPAHPGGGDTAFFEGDEATMLATPEMDGAVPAIARLVSLFAGRVWLISKCGPRVQARTLRWLEGHNFYQRTGLPAAHVRFCRTRPDKRVHCQQLALTHLVDDHPEVHAAIRGTVDYQYFFGPQRHPVPGYGIHTLTWADLETHITNSLTSYACHAAPAGHDAETTTDLAPGSAHRAFTLWALAGQPQTHRQEADAQPQGRSRIQNVVPPGQHQQR